MYDHDTATLPPKPGGGGMGVSPFSYSTAETAQGRVEQIRGQWDCDGSC